MVIISYQRVLFTIYAYISSHSLLFQSYTTTPLGPCNTVMGCVATRWSATRGGCSQTFAKFIKKLSDIFSGVAPANQTKERAKTKSSWISPIFVNSGVFPWENQHDSLWTFFFFSGMPPGKVHELAFLWFGLPGWLLIFPFGDIPQSDVFLC